MRTSSGSEGNWQRLIAGVRPYWGRDVSVSLEEKATDAVDGHQFVQLSLGLSFKDYQRSGLGLIHASSRYDPVVEKQLKHQVGLRLESLSGLFIVDFSSASLDYDNEQVTPQLLRELKSPRFPSRMGFVHDPWLRELLTDVKDCASYR